MALDSVFLFSGHADLLPSTNPDPDRIVIALFGSGNLTAATQAIVSAIRGRK